MKKLTSKSSLLILSTGLLLIVLAYEGYNFYLTKKYLSSSEKILNFDPYQYQKKTKATVQYFYSSLPYPIQIAIQNRKMNYEYLTSCEGNLLPGLYSDFAITFFANGAPHLFVFEPGAFLQTKNVFDISKGVASKKMAPNDYFEIHCPKAARILNNPLFQSEKDSAEQINFLKEADLDVIQIKNKSSDSSEIFAYNSKLAGFQKIGEERKPDSTSSSDDKDSVVVSKSPEKVFPLLPASVQDDIHKKFSDFSSLTACQGDFFFRDDTFVVKIKSEKGLAVKIYAVNGAGVIKDFADLTNDLGLSPNQSQDVEIKCRQAAFLLNNPLFQVNPRRWELASLYQRSNRSLLLVKSAGAKNYDLFARDPKENQFYLIGTYPAH